MKRNRAKVVRNEFVVLASSLVITGFLLLFESFGYLNGISRLWPVFSLIIGIGLAMLFRNQGDTGLLWLGSLMIMLSLFFFYLNFTSWRRLAMLWPVFIAIFGLAFLFCYSINKNRAVLIASIFTILLSIAFILIFSLSIKLWPISLIIAGIFMYIVSKCNQKNG
ncbi:hypothetical protein J4433_01770 [Candidatus Pacearchaeota archaeon]|nr:hypothetical protein [Candidatus Pacearchaeota archaeon]